MNHMVIANIIVGLALLVLGKRLFWLFVGAIGFIAASDAAAAYFSALPHWQILTISIAAGLLGVLLAIFFQKLAIVLVGFYAGGYLAVSLFTTFHIALSGNLPLAPFVVGGILGPSCCISFLTGPSLCCPLLPAPLSSPKRSNPWESRRLSL